MDHFSYALEKARELPIIRGRYRHYALVLSKRGKILGESSNSYTKTSPKMMFAAMKVGLPFKQFWHAEARALHMVKNVNKIHKIVVVRVGASGEALNSKPCSICERLIIDMKLKSVEYSL